MSAPDRFSWVEKPYLAAMARPTDRDELIWLRSQGIQLVISLTESALRRDWVNDAGLMAVHVPVVDLTPPAPEQLDHCLSVINRAIDQKMGVVVHCAAGLGRTGTLLAAWYVFQGLDPATAITKVREMRPGSIETPEQERAVYEYGKTAPKQKPKPPVAEKKPRITPESMKAASRKIDEAFENVAKLAGTDLPSERFFHQFLELVVAGIDAPAGAVWLRTPKRLIQLQCQVRIDDVELDKHKNGRQTHSELLQQAFQMSRPMLLEPFGTSGILEGNPAGNPTQFFCLLVPIMQQKDTAGMLELWIEPRHNVQMQRTFLNYLVQMAGYVGQFLRRHPIALSPSEAPPTPTRPLPMPELKKTGNARIDDALENIAQLAKVGVDQNAFFHEFIDYVASGIASLAGAIWLKTPAGFLQLQCQLNIENVLLDKHKNGRQSHNELLRQAIQMSRPMLLEPYGTSGILEGLPAGNPTDFYCLIAPIHLEAETAGLIELWTEKRHDATVQKSFLNFLMQMSQFAAYFLSRTK